MKKIIIVSGIIGSVLFAADFPDFNQLKTQAAASVEQAANLAGIKTLIQNITPIQFKFNASTLELSDPQFKIAGYDVDQLMKTVVIPALSEVINKLPTDKKIAIIGHASQKGAEDASNGFVGNIALSKKRADVVLSYILKNSKLDKNRFAIVAKGSSEPLNGVDPSDDKNCRTVFDIQ